MLKSIIKISACSLWVKNQARSILIVKIGRYLIKLRLQESSTGTILSKVGGTSVDSLWNTHYLEIETVLELS